MLVAGYNSNSKAASQCTWLAKINGTGFTWPRATEHVCNQARVGRLECALTRKVIQVLHSPELIKFPAACASVWREYVRLFH